MIRQGARRVGPQSARWIRTLKTVTNPEPQVPKYFAGPIEASAPVHSSYILLHAPNPPAEFPSVYKTPLSLELASRVKKWGGIVNFSWFDAETARDATEGRQGATVFSELGGRLEIRNVSLANMDQVEDAIQKHVRGPLTKLTTQEVHIYVCTHGARDCRCGHRGRAVLDALKQSVKDAQERSPSGPATRIKVGAVGHIGGHKYAANLLIFPLGEWLGLVKPEDAPSIVARVSEVLEQGVKPLGLSAPISFPSHWRGRMGLSKEEQKNLLAKCQA